MLSSVALTCKSTRSSVCVPPKHLGTHTLLSLDHTILSG
jgi:hypothetical protein